MSQRLIIEDDEGTTTIVPLGKDAVTIGRQQGNTIQLTEKNVSRRHARLYPEQAAWVIEDLASYNGIKVNGVPIDGRVTLKEGDVVQIGDYHLALTEDVDKRTLGYQGAAIAANDPAVVEPMLASSSTDLPRLSAEELAALQSGPHAVSPPALLDSGPVPATPMPGGYEERRKGGSGVLVGFGVVVALALVGGIAWMAMGGPDDKAATQVAAKDEAPAAVRADAKAAPPVEEAKTLEAPTPPPTGPAPSDDGAVVEAEEGAAPPDPEPAEADGGEPELVIPDDAGEAADEPPDVAAKKKNTKSQSKPKTSSVKKDPGPPPAPPAPAVDVSTMMKEARALALKNPSAGYDLASKALKAGAGREAAELMATCACRMKDAAKAKRALSRLSGAAKERVANLCKEKGVSV